MSSVLVVVIAVRGVTMFAVNIVDVVFMLDGFVAAICAVIVVMRLGLDVRFERALVVVPIVLVMKVPVMQVVDVVGVGHSDVTTIGVVVVLVVLVNGVGFSHGDT